MVLVDIISYDPGSYVTILYMCSINILMSLQYPS